MKLGFVLGVVFLFSFDLFAAFPWGKKSLEAPVGYSEVKFYDREEMASQGKEEEILVWKEPHWTARDIPLIHADLVVKSQNDVQIRLPWFDKPVWFSGKRWLKVVLQAPKDMVKKQGNIVQIWAKDAKGRQQDTFLPAGVLSSQNPLYDPEKKTFTLFYVPDFSDEFENIAEIGLKFGFSHGSSSENITIKSAVLVHQDLQSDPMALDLLSIEKRQRIHLVGPRASCAVPLNQTNPFDRYKFRLKVRVPYEWAHPSQPCSLMIWLKDFDFQWHNTSWNKGKISAIHPDKDLMFPLTMVYDPFALKKGQSKSKTFNPFNIAELGLKVGLPKNARYTLSGEIEVLEAVFVDRYDPHKTVAVNFPDKVLVEKVRGSEDAYETQALYKFKKKSNFVSSFGRRLSVLVKMPRGLIQKPNLAAQIVAEDIYGFKQASKRVIVSSRNPFFDPQTRLMRVFFTPKHDKQGFNPDKIASLQLKLMSPTGIQAQHDYLGMLRIKRVSFEDPVHAPDVKNLLTWKKGDDTPVLRSHDGRLIRVNVTEKGVVAKTWHTPQDLKDRKVSLDLFIPPALVKKAGRGARSKKESPSLFVRLFLKAKKDRVQSAVFPVAHGGPFNVSISPSLGESGVSTEPGFDPEEVHSIGLEVIGFDGKARQSSYLFVDSKVKIEGVGKKNEVKINFKTTPFSVGKEEKDDIKGFVPLQENPYQGQMIVQLEDNGELVFDIEDHALLSKRKWANRSRVQVDLRIPKSFMGFWHRHNRARLFLADKYGRRQYLPNTAIVARPKATRGWIRLHGQPTVDIPMPLGFTQEDFRPNKVEKIGISIEAGRHGKSLSGKVEIKDLKVVFSDDELAPGVLEKDPAVRAGENERAAQMTRRLHTVFGRYGQKVIVGVNWAWPSVVKPENKELKQLYGRLLDTEELWGNEKWDLGHGAVRKKVDQEFAAMHETFGDKALVRVWLFNDFRAGMERDSAGRLTITQRSYTNMQKLLALAQKHNLIIWPVLTDFMLADRVTGEGPDAKWKVGEHPAFITDPVLRGEFIKALKDFVSYFKGNDSILCWELMNEPTNAAAVTTLEHFRDLQIFLRDGIKAIQSTGELATVGYRNVAAAHMMRDIVPVDLGQCHYWPYLETMENPWKLSDPFEEMFGPVPYGWGEAPVFSDIKAQLEQAAQGQHKFLLFWNWRGDDKTGDGFHVREHQEKIKQILQEYMKEEKKTSEEILKLMKKPIQIPGYLFVLLCLLMMGGIIVNYWKR